MPNPNFNLTYFNTGKLTTVRDRRLFKCVLLELKKL